MRSRSKSKQVREMFREVEGLRKLLMTDHEFQKLGGMGDDVSKGFFRAGGGALEWLALEEVKGT